KVHSGAMPPSKKNRLSKTDVETIRRWITTGVRADAKAKPLSAPVTRDDVLPILLRRCAVCHGAHRQEGKLDLRSKAAMLRGGVSGPAIVIEKPDASLLIKKIRAGQMPPRHRLVEVSVKPIEQSETDVLVRWIAAGAPEVVVRPDVATTTPDLLVSDKDRTF